MAAAAAAITAAWSALRRTNNRSCRRTLRSAYDAIFKAPTQRETNIRPTMERLGGGLAAGRTSVTDGNAAVGSNTVTATTYGSAAGMEYRDSPDPTLGFALAGGGLNWGLAQGLGTGRSDAFQAGVYGKRHLGPAYLSGGRWRSATTGSPPIEPRRSATSSPRPSAARATPRAVKRDIVIAANGASGVTPYGALQTQWFHTPA